MNYFDNIIGNRALTQRLSQDIAQKSLSHAYIIEGKSGSGRHTVALSTAAAIACRDASNAPCGRCICCTRVQERQFTITLFMRCIAN